MVSAPLVAAVFALACGIVVAPAANAVPGAPTNDTTTHHPIVDQPPAPIAMNYCGDDMDEIAYPSTSLPISYVSDGMTVTAIPNEGETFTEGLVTTWDMSDQFPYVACPIFIVDAPEAPTVCKGAVSVPDSTEDVMYAIDSVNAYGVPQAGRLFVQDLVTPGLDHIVWPISSLEEVCPPAEEPYDTFMPPMEGEEPIEVIPSVDTEPVVETPAEVVAPIVPAAADAVIPSAPLANMGGDVVDTAQPHVAAASTMQLAETGFDPYLLALAIVLLGTGIAVVRKFGVIGSVKR